MFWQIKQSAMPAEATKYFQKDATKFLRDLTSNRKEKGNDNYFMHRMRTIMLKPEGNICRERSVQ